MKIVLASANKGKITEFQKLMPNDEVIAFSEILGKIEIVEDKDSFKGNAIKKAQTIYEELIKIGQNDVIVISDDSGITVPALNNEPGIYSARYAGEGSSDKENNAKLIEAFVSYFLLFIPLFYFHVVYYTIQSSIWKHEKEDAAALSTY